MINYDRHIKYKAKKFLTLLPTVTGEAHTLLES